MALISILVSCLSLKTTPKIQSVSTMKQVMTGVDLSSNLLWDTITRDHLFAVAPLHHLEGEVTIINGKMYVSHVDSEDQVFITDTWNVRSPFAVFSHIPFWNSTIETVKINSELELQKLIEQKAKKMRYNLERPFAFRIKGHFDSIAYHIISKPKDEIEHNHELHKKAKKHFFLAKTDGELIGFYSRHHEGVFTHKGSYIHTHFVNDSGTHAGHLEHVTIVGKVEIMLPK